ncbi:hypothetical protein EKO04_009402 [Ascochyta lentis]|uniref:F-box domain-containing protein n=1 Tax=Ascochyta lentis TaxID=205686 RepID=A0A8H7MBW4_9PLEO|nr:hypothetical protein EKO04_009402 [Ascochyta lentis]
MSEMFLEIDTPIEELEDSLLASCDDGPNLLDRSPAHNKFQSNSACPGGSFIANDLSQNLVVAALVLQYSNIATRNNLRLTCRSWYNAVTFLAQPIRPASDRLPTEILLNIYNHLGAKDFNAARRTCRGWMLASLNKSLLTTMLRRGGWHDDSQKKDNDAAQSNSTTETNQEWILSRILARECALASHWTGNGLDVRPAIVDNSDIDFSELAHGYTFQKNRASGGLIFTSSFCGKYLLVAKDTLIYIYSLEDGLLRPLTSVVCPRRILAMSMNASVGRDAVAALLEGRMGMVCELRYGRPSPEPSSGDKYVEGEACPPRTSTQPLASSGVTGHVQDAINPAEPNSPVVVRSFPHDQNSDVDSFNAIELKTHNQGFSLRGTDDTSTHDRNLIAQTWNLSLRGPLKNLRSNSKAAVPVQNIPIESGTSTFYRHLCSEDDPPRNVSICPQRRCVAFGCSAGIELHWIDALTGQSLSRWFPLTSPSDHLYFLSPRSGFESAKKLRLISSAAHPSHRPAISRRLFNNPTKSSFWGSFGFESRSRHPPNCDHYHAIPLSDGHHVLFIDPSDNRLALGCDAPLGGPTKLLRKIIFNPPGEKIVPRIYTAAADMSSGARIVAVYENTVMLYSIPPDVLSLSRLEQAAESWDVYNAPSSSSAERHQDHWLNWWDEPTIDSANRSEDGTIWPLSLSGTQIGRLSGICELAIQTQPDMIIWAFTYTSQCKTWRLRNYTDPVTQTKQFVDGSGLVHEPYQVDESGDVIMQDAPPCTALAHVHGDTVEWEGLQLETRVLGGFDGHSSGVLKRLPRALAVENDGWVDAIDVFGCGDAWFEGGGDVVVWSGV